MSMWLVIFETPRLSGHASPFRKCRIWPLHVLSPFKLSAGHQLSCKIDKRLGYGDSFTIKSKQKFNIVDPDMTHGIRHAQRSLMRITRK